MQRTLAKETGNLEWRYRGLARLTESTGTIYREAWLEKLGTLTGVTEKTAQRCTCLQQEIQKNLKPESDNCVQIYRDCLEIQGLLA
jgi:hypothetical protein